MDNETKYNLQNINKNDLKDFFKELVEDTRHSTETKTQTILQLLNSLKEETEKKISKSKILFFINYKIFSFSYFFL